MRILKVVWNDAWSDDSEEYTKKAIRKAHGPFVQTSVGLEVVNDKQGITLAGDYDADGAYHRVLFIPKGIIKSVVVL